LIPFSKHTDLTFKQTQPTRESKSASLPCCSQNQEFWPEVSLL
jgi:hypothetical protein